MKLNVPFFKQTSELNCGPVALKMVLAYFGGDYDMDFLERKMNMKKGKGISTLKIATTAASLGHKTYFYSKHLFMNEENFKLDFYKKYAEDGLLEQSKKLVEEAKEGGVNVEEKTLELKELLSKVTENSVPIILVDWNVIMNRTEKGLRGHFVPIVGHDEKDVFVHNHGLKDNQEFMPIKRELFDEARKAEGTDEDIIIIHRNSTRRKL